MSVGSLTRRTTAVRKTRSIDSPSFRKSQPGSRARVCSMAPAVERIPRCVAASALRNVGGSAICRRLIGLELLVRLVQRDEHLDGQGLADGAGIVARLLEREEDRVGMARIDRQGVQGGLHQRPHAARGLAAVAVGEDRVQLAPLRPGHLLVETHDLAAHLLGDDQEAGDVLRPLEIASHPVERVGDPGEDHGSRGASTQVSLLPPPWEELTTNEPARSATRVRPPGKTRMRSP